MASVDFTVPYLTGEAERAFDRWLAAAASVAHWDNSVKFLFGGKEDRPLLSIPGFDCVFMPLAMEDF